MEPDPLQEIREIRRRISSECDHDPAKVFDYYSARQAAMMSTGNYEFVSRPSGGLSAGDPAGPVPTPVPASE